MDKNKKPFKPGQLVTISNHVFRVVKSNKNRPECFECAFPSIAYQMICKRFCIKSYYSKDRPMLENCYFKLVK